MDERTFQRRLVSLLGGIEDLPEAAQEALAKCAGLDGQGDDDLKPVDLLHAMRLGVTYIVFDLEATRRENRFLRRMLNEQSQSRSDARDHEDEREGE